jgi:hypothetical protein
MVSNVLWGMKFVEWKVLAALFVSLLLTGCGGQSSAGTGTVQAQGFSNATFNGTYAFGGSYAFSGGTAYADGQFTFDGKGNITSGLELVNINSPVVACQYSLAGSYIFNTSPFDGTGRMTITATPYNGQTALGCQLTIITFTYDIATGGQEFFFAGTASQNFMGANTGISGGGTAVKQ